MSACKQPELASSDSVFFDTFPDRDTIANNTIILNVVICGNNIIEPREICDGTSLNGQTCSSQGFADGTLKCNPSCTAYDTTLCYF